MTRGPPYGRDDVPYLEAQLERARTRFRAALEAWQEAGTPTRDMVKSAEEEMTGLEATLEKAKEAPLRKELEVRLAYETALSLIKEAHARLLLFPEPETEVETEEPRPEWGAYARGIQRAEHDLETLRDARDAFGTQDGLPKVVEERLSNLERLDEQVREQEERIAFIERIRKALLGSVFSGYEAYEDQVAAALLAFRQLEQLWPELERSGAVRYPEPAMPPSKVARTWFREGPSPDVPGIQTLWEGRVGLGRGERPLDIRKHTDTLAKLRQELEQRRFLRDRLISDADRLRTLEAQKSRSSAAESPSTTTAVASSEYSRLGDRISKSKLRIEEMQIESAKLETELEAVETELSEKKKELSKAQEELSTREAELASKEATRDLLFPLDRQAPDGRPRRIHNFVAAQTIAASRKGIEALQHAVRRIEIRRDVVTRKLDSIAEERSRIEEVQLPSLRGSYYQALAQTAAIRGVRILIVIALALILVRVVQRGSRAYIQRTIAAEERAGLEAIRQQRTRTLMNVFAGAARVLIHLTALFFIVGQLDIDYGPLLVAAGGLSLAVGFGAQSLVKDFFAGFFILLEGQYSIGDVVEIDGKGGVVEDLNLRTTVLRSLTGEVHTIPNGEISTTTNKTKNWSRAVLDIGVAYEENIDEIISVLAKVGADMKSDDAYRLKVRNVDVLGLESLADSAVVVRVLLETRPGDQWAMGREYLRRVKATFDQLDIEIPWPQRVVTEKSSVTEAGSAARKRRAIRRFVGTEPEGGTGSHTVLSVEERDRAGVIAQKEASILEEQAAESHADLKKAEAEAKKAEADSKKAEAEAKKAETDSKKLEKPEALEAEKMEMDGEAPAASGDEDGRS